MPAAGDQELETGISGGSQIEDMDTADTDVDAGILSPAVPDPTNNNPHLHTEPSSSPSKLGISPIPESAHIRSPSESTQGANQSPLASPTTVYNPSPHASQNPALAPPHATLSAPPPHALSVGALKALRGILSKVTGAPGSGTGDQGPWSSNLSMPLPGNTGHWPPGDVPSGMPGFVEPSQAALLGVQTGFSDLAGVNPAFPTGTLPLVPEQAALAAALPMSHFAPVSFSGGPGQPSMEHVLNPQSVMPPFVGRGGGVRRGGTFAPRGRGRDRAPYQ